VTLLERVAASLDAAGVAHALIGAAALAVHGVSRATLDQDLLVVDAVVLNEDFWTPIAATTRFDIRRGDDEDPLAGVVRLTQPDERDVDVVVGRHAWERSILERAERVGRLKIPVARAADIILLKLYAGGSQDRWDIEQLLALDERETLAADVDSRLDSLPPRCRSLWTALRSG
jgi:hypothetical protein